MDSPSASSATRPMFEQLPNEVLLEIFQMLRNDTTTGSFLRCLLVSRRCHELGIRVLWQDLVLTNENLELFVHRVPYLQKISPVRSMTVRLLLTRPTRKEFSADLQYLLSNTFAARPRMDWLDQLANRLAVLINKYFRALSTFSLFIGKNRVMPPNFLHLESDSYISANLVNTLLQALPPACTSLEIDTEGLDKCFNSGLPVVHICCTVRSLMPQLTHLRLRMHSYCGSLFDSAHDSQFVDPGARPSQDSPIHLHAPHLKTLILSLSPEPKNDKPRPCGRLPKTINPASINPSTQHDDDIRFILAAALRDAHARQAFPTIKRLEIFNIRSRHREARSHISCQDILADKTRILPLHLLQPDKPDSPHQPGGIFVVGASRKIQYFGFIPTIEHELEQAWHTTTFGSRFPMTFHHSSGTSFEWCVPQIVNLMDFNICSASWRALLISSHRIPGTEDVLDDAEGLAGTEGGLEGETEEQRQLRKRWRSIKWKKPEVVSGCGEEAFRNW